MYRCSHYIVQLKEEREVERKSGGRLDGPRRRLVAGALGRFGPVDARRMLPGYFERFSGAGGGSFPRDRIRYSHQVDIGMVDQHQ